MNGRKYLLSRMKTYNNSSLSSILYIHFLLLVITTSNSEQIRLPAISIGKDRAVCLNHEPNLNFGGGLMGLGNHLLFELMNVLSVTQIIKLSYVGLFLRNDWSNSIFEGSGKFVKYTDYFMLGYGNTKVYNYPIISCEEIIIKNVKEIQNISVKYPVMINFDYNLYDKPEFIRSFLRTITPTSNIRRKINFILKELGNFVAFHVREEDDWKDSHKGKFLESYFNVEKNFTNKTIYIASAKKFPKNKQKDQYVKIRDNLEGSIIDMFICSKAERFYGVLSSTFSLVISYLRDNNTNLFGYSNVFWNENLNKSYLSKELNYTFYKI